MSAQEFITSVNAKAEELSKKYNCKVSCETWTTDKDGNELPEEEFVVAYIREPHFLAAAKAFDALSNGRPAEAGGILWSSCVLLGNGESSKEIEQTKYRIGLQCKIGLSLDVIMPDKKK